MIKINQGQREIVCSKEHNQSWRVRLTCQQQMTVDWTDRGSVTKPTDRNKIIK